MFSRFAGVGVAPGDDPSVELPRFQPGVTDTRADYRMNFKERKAFFKALGLAYGKETYPRTEATEALLRIMLGEVLAGDLAELEPIVRTFYKEVIRPKLPTRFLESFVTGDHGLLGNKDIAVEMTISELHSFTTALLRRESAPRGAPSFYHRGDRGGGKGSSRSGHGRGR